MEGKRIALNVVKVIAGLAAVVFWFCPLSTWNQVLLCVGSIAVLLICFLVSGELDDRNTGYWPPEATGSRPGPEAPPSPRSPEVHDEKNPR